jgi:pimeloyl-ACP methyl ester carboxylesterase
LLLNPGGPGASGVDFAIFRAPTLYTEEVRARFDLVGFDPRGVGRSGEIRCFRSADEWLPFSPPWWFPITPEQQEAWIEFDRLIIDGCRELDERVARHVSTANAARDLDELRQALGDKKLTYAGYSYGSYLGETYANLFPRNVRALVIDGVIDPIAYATGRSGDGSTVPAQLRIGSHLGTQDTLGEFFRLCDGAGSRCAFAPDSAARWRALGERLKAQPLEGFDYSALIATTSVGLRRSEAGRWEQLAQLLADIETEANAGGSARVPGPERQLAARAAHLQAESDPAGPDPFDGFPDPGFGGEAVGCVDQDNPRSYSSLADAASARGEFGLFWGWQFSRCTEWPFVDTDRYTGPFTRATANPVLVIGNLFDPATPYQGAVEAAKLMPNSVLLTVRAWGHISLRLAQCANQVASRYLIALTLPAPGTVCEQDSVPFAAP